MDGIDNGELVRRLQQIPAIREISRLVQGAVRPVDWNLAHQISQAVAGSALRCAQASSKDRQELEQACRIAELAVIGQSDLGPVRGVTSLRLLSRTEWSTHNLEVLKPLVERLAARLAAPAPPGASTPGRALLDALAPLVMGAQFGLTFGYLSHKALGTWDMGLPQEAIRSVRAQTGMLIFNFPNMVDVETELDVDPRQFRMWLALREVTHELLFQAVGWSGPYFQGLVEAYIDAAQVDTSELALKLSSLSDPLELAGLLQRPEELVPMLRNPAQQVIAGKIESFLSLTEAYSDWIVRRGGLSLIEAFERIREGMSRRTAERSAPERMLEKLFGLDLSNRNRRAGERFVAALAEAGKVPVLWRKVENLPTLEELAQPQSWISRVGVV